jgi:hypothetical protein
LATGKEKGAVFLQDCVRYEKPLSFSQISSTIREKNLYRYYHTDQRFPDRHYFHSTFLVKEYDPSQAGAG